MPIGRTHCCKNLAESDCRDIGSRYASVPPTAAWAAWSNEDSSMRRQLHLNLFIHSRGHHEASWRHPSASPLPLTDIRYYQDLARRAEAALFDSVFLADQLALGEDVSQAPRTWLEALTGVGVLAGAT